MFLCPRHQTTILLQILGHYKEKVFYSLSPSFLSGTGSYPLVPPGLHLNILFDVNSAPEIMPLFFIASRAYSEHEGMCRHLGPMTGDTKVL